MIIKRLGGYQHAVYHAVMEVLHHGDLLNEEMIPILVRAIQTLSGGCGDTEACLEDAAIMLADGVEGPAEIEELDHD